MIWLIRIWFFFLILCAILFWGYMATLLIPYVLKHPSGLLKSFGIALAVIVGIGAIYVAFAQLKRKAPNVHGWLETIGSLALAILVLFVLVGGMLRSCKHPDRCTAAEARFSGC